MLYSVTSWATLATVLSFAASIQAHMQMSSPYPLKSPLSPNVPEGQKDYSMTSPLPPNALALGQFPCKGYHKDKTLNQNAVVTYTAGEAVTVTLAGSATHNGGSCQISLSYDDGATFKVIHSFEGGCPLNKNLPITIPKDAPSGSNILFAWSWLNYSGNREYYMNCARVTIKGTSASPSSWIKPGLYLANIYGEGTCNTVEGRNYVFPYPGDAVTYGGDVTANTKYSASQLQGAKCPAGADGSVSGYAQGTPAASTGSTSSGSSNYNNAPSSSSSSSVSETSPTAAPVPVSSTTSLVPVAQPTKTKKSKCRPRTKTVSAAAQATY